MANTALIGLLLPTQGTLNGTWGDAVNSQITSLIDSAIAGTTELTADADAVLSATVTAPNEARQAILLCTGVRTAVRTIAPPSSSKTYVVINTTTGGFGVTIGGVTIPAGYACAVAWNGASFVPSSSYIPNAKLDNLLLTNALTVANGGTGATTLTGLVVGNGTGAMTTVAAPSGTVVGTTDTQTLTSKTISGSNNTLSSIANASLTNSSVTINGETVSLGGTATIGAATSQPLTVGTGLQYDTGTTFNGAVAKTISVNNTVATLTGAQTLTNKTLTTPVISSISNTGTITLPLDTTTLVGRGTTDTLTNKRITSRVETQVTTLTLAPAANSYDQFCITAQSTPLAISNPTGTPTDGQKIILRIKDDGTARALTWGADYRAIGVVLPTATTASKVSYIGCIYNTNALKWDVVAAITEE